MYAMDVFSAEIILPEKQENVSVERNLKNFVIYVFFVRSRIMHGLFLRQINCLRKREKSKKNF